MNMDGKVALVTGSTSGIGRPTAVALAGRGGHVLVTGRNQERGGQVVDTIRNTGGNADFLQATLSGVESARALARQAVDAGGGHVDIWSTTLDSRSAARPRPPRRQISTRPTPST
jgi:NAD(P)-dependent dehydrogenase (short-subunit alcohol dehydrogenase family)